MFSEAIPLVYQRQFLFVAGKGGISGQRVGGGCERGLGGGGGGAALREPLGLTLRRRRCRQHCRRCCRQLINKERERAQRGDGRG